MKRWPLILIAIFVLYLGASVVSPFLNSFAWATFTVLTTWPIYLRLRKFLISSPSWSALVMTLGVLVVFLLGVVPLAVQLSRELKGIAEVSPEQAESLVQIVKQKLSSIPYLGEQFDPSKNGFTFSASEISELLVRYKEQSLHLAASITKSFLGAIASFFATFLIMFFLFRDGAELGSQLVTAAHRVGGQHVAELLKIARTTVRAAIFGYLLTAIAQGLLAGIGYAIVGVPMPLLFAALTTVASLMPFGTPFVYVPIITYMLFFSDSSFASIALLAVWCVVVVSLVDNLVRPMVISQATSLSFLLVLIGVLGGIINFGLIGIVLGPVILALIHAIWLSFVRIQWHEEVDNGSVVK